MSDFDEYMRKVRDQAEQMGGLPPGGIEWNLAPLKRMMRVVEKLCLAADERQRSALDKCDGTMLDASGMLDTVRGMFICGTMEHAAVLLELLGAEANKEEGKRAFTLKRSKNRFLTPSDGGWMDCLINFELQLGDIMLG